MRAKFWEDYEDFMRVRIRANEYEGYVAPSLLVNLCDFPSLHSKVKKSLLDFLRNICHFHKLFRKKGERDGGYLH